MPVYCILVETDDPDEIGFLRRSYDRVIEFKSEPVILSKDKIFLAHRMLREKRRLITDETIRNKMKIQSKMLDTLMIHGDLGRFIERLNRFNPTKNYLNESNIPDAGDSESITTSYS